MPIPILKMKPQKRAEETRIPNTGIAKGTASPRGIPRGTPVHTNPVSSHIPSPLSPRENRSRIATFASKNQRPAASAGPARQSPRPPPRTSSTVPETKLRATTKNPNTQREPMYTKNKSASSVAPKRFEYSAPTSSNRSSMVSNCSSIPPPSSGSSNRNSNSSIGSGFSVGSWNSTHGQSPEEEDSPFNCGGADTFPRSGYNSRLRQPEEQLTKSMEEPSKTKPVRRTLPRPTRQQPKAKMSGKQLSSSETAIPNKNRVVLPTCNYSDTNLTTLRGMKPKFGTAKPIAAVKGNTKSMSPRSSEEDLAGRKVSSRDNVAFVAPYSESKKTTRKNRDTADEDDGYSSVANTDQSEETYSQRRQSLEEDDYDEVAEIEPMKPLQVSKCYLMKDRRTQDPSKPIEKKGSGSKDLLNKSEPTIKPPQDNTEKLKEINSAKLYQRQSFPSKQSNGDMEERPQGKPGTRVTDKRPSQPNICMQNFPKSEAKSALDDSVLKLSYKDFVKRETSEKGAYNWMSRNTIDVKLSKEPHRRKLTYPEPPSISQPLSTNPISSFDKRSHPSQARRSLELPQRPNSLNTDKLLEARGSDSFQRSGSLRSPSLDSTPETKILCYSGSQGHGPSRKYGGPSSSPSFNRGAYKYSTVIPRTSNETKDRRDSAYSSASPSDSKSMEKTLQTEENSRPEIESLKKDLKTSQESILSLKEQLASSNKLVSAYEHSLTNMTHRLHQLSKITEQKDCEISELRRLLERSCTESNMANFKSNTIGGRSMNRGPSIESLTSLMSTDSISSSISTTSTTSNMSSADPESRDKHKKKNWLRSSFSKAFKRKAKRSRGDESATDTESESQNPFYGRSISECDTTKGYCSLPSSPLPQRFQPATNLDKTNTVYHSQQQIASVLDEVTRLRISLEEKDSALTESRLESLSSAHQIEALKESIHKLTMEVTCLRSRERNNAITQALTSRKSQCSTNTKTIRVVLHPEKSTIRTIDIASTTSWKDFDTLLSKAIMEFCQEVDPDLALSVTPDCISRYSVGEIIRTVNGETPEFLPYGYLVGEVDSVRVTLKNVEAWSLDSCIPMGNLQDYFSHLKEHRRVILAGPRGTSKKYIASKVASLVLERLGVKPSNGNVAKFQVTSDNQHDLAPYLSHVSDLCLEKSPDLPLVIILEQLEGVERLQDILSSSLRVPHDQCPYIIGTMRLSKTQKDSLSLTNNFKWVFLDPELEPIQGILPRVCRRQRIIHQKQDSDEDMIQFLHWLPLFYKKFNAVLNGTSAEILGPCIFTPIPHTLIEAKSWFNNIWKSHLLPLIQKAARDTTFIPQDTKLWDSLGKCLSEDLPWKSSEIPDLPQPLKKTDM